MTCQIKVDESTGEVLNVFSKDGDESQLYRDLLNLYNDQYKALDEWNVTQSIDFKEWFGNDNIEPTIKDLDNYRLFNLSLQDEAVITESGEVGFFEDYPDDVFSLLSKETNEIVSMIDTNIEHNTKILQRFGIDTQNLAAIDKENTELKVDANTIKELWKTMTELNSSSMLENLNTNLSVLSRNLITIKNIIEKYQNRELDSIMSDDILREQFFSDMLLSQQFVSVYSPITGILDVFAENVKEEDLTETQKQIRETLGKMQDIGKLIMKYATILSNGKHDGILNRAYKILIEKHTTNPNITSGMLEVYFPTDDIGEIQKWLDTPTATGSIELSNILKMFTINDGKKMFEIRERLERLNDESIAFFEDLIAKPGGAGKLFNPSVTLEGFRVLAEEERSKLRAKMFIDLFIRKNEDGTLTDRIVTEIRWDKFIAYQKQLKVIDAQYDQEIADYDIMIDEVDKELKTITDTSSIKYNELDDKRTELYSKRRKVIEAKKAMWKDFNENHTINADIIIDEKGEEVATPMFIHRVKKQAERLYDSKIEQENWMKHYLADFGIYFNDFENEWVKKLPNPEKYTDEQYKMIQEDERLKKYYDYIVNEIKDIMSFMPKFDTSTGILPLIPNMPRSVKDSLEIFMQTNEVQATKEFPGIGNQIVYQLPFNFFSRLGDVTSSKRKIEIPKKTQSVNEEGVVVTTTDAEIWQTLQQQLRDANFFKEDGTEFKSLREVKDYNAQLAKEQEEYHVEHMTFDPVKVMQGFINGAVDYKYKKKIEKQLLLGKQILANLDFLQRYKKSDYARTDSRLSSMTGEHEYATIKKENSNIYQIYDNWLKTYFYGVVQDRKAFDKVARFLIQYTSMKGMWLNITSGIGNTLKGNIDEIIEGFAKEYYDLGDYKNALGAYLKEGLVDSLANTDTDKRTTLTGALMELFDVVELYDERGMGYDKSIKNVLDKVLIHTNSMYIFMNGTEHQLQNTTLLGMMRHYRVIDNKLKSFNDYLEDTRKDVLFKLVDDETKREIEDYVANRIRDEKYKERQHDYIGDWLRDFGINVLNDEQRKQYTSNVKTDIKAAKTEFEKNPRLIDQYELINGYAKIKQDSTINEHSEEWKTEFTLFREKVKRLNQTMHGVYNLKDAPMLQSRIVGELVLQFKKWMRPNWNRRFGSKFGTSIYDESLGKFDSGYYTEWWKFITKPFKNHPLGLVKRRNQQDATILKALWNIIRDYGKFTMNASFMWSTMTRQQRADIRRTNMEIMSIIMLAIILKALGGLRDDDDDDSYALNWATYQTNRLYAEMVGLVPLYGWYNTANQFMNQPFAAEKTLVDTFKMFVHLFAYPFRDEDERIFKGGYKHGQDKFEYYLKQNFPVGSQYVKMARLNDMVSYYKFWNLFQ